jgi:membrane protease YdiL (CAAX protease family)
VIFLFAVFLSVAIVGSYKLTLSAPIALRPQLRDIASAAILGGLVALITVVVPEFRRTLPALFSRGSSRMSGTDFLLAMGLMIAWSYGIYFVCFKWPAAAWGFLFPSTLPPLESKYLTFFLVSVLVAPIVEELFFRGYLLNLWRARWGTWVAILLSSLVFGLFHFERTIFAAAAGVVFALVYLRYDSLWPGVILHGAVNFAAFPWFLPRLSYLRPRATDISAWIPEIVLAVLFIPLAVMFWRRFKPNPAA